MRVVLGFLVLLSLFMVACGGGSGSSSTSVTVPTTVVPVISSTAVITAAQGQLYSYTLVATDPSGGALRYALTQSPQGASLSGSTVSWTPTTAQSRIANAFEVTVTNSAGGSAKQSWTVTPSGDVTISCRDTYYHAQGTTSVPVDLSNAQMAAYTADAGTLIGNAVAQNANTLTISNVPGGAYWLAVSTYDGSAMSPTYYRLTGSTFDCGMDWIGRTGVQSAVQSGSTVTGLDPWTTTDTLTWYSPNTGTPFWNLGGPNTGATTWADNGTWTHDLVDSAQGDVAYLAQYHQSSIGPLTITSLARALTYSNLTPINNGNNLNGAMAQPPATTVRANLAAGTVPGVVARMHPQALMGQSETDFSFMPYAGTHNAQIQWRPPIFGRSAGVWDSNMPTIAVLKGTLTDNVDFGDITAYNPFPASWTPFVSSSQSASVPLTAPGATTSRNLVLSTGHLDLTMPSASTPIAIAMTPVAAPTIDGNSFTSGATISSAPLLAWNPPSGLQPNTYEVGIVELVNNGGATAFGAQYYLDTDQTSLRVPAGLLSAGSTYAFFVTAYSTGATLSAPLHWTLPLAWSMAASSEMTVSGATASPASQTSTIQATPAPNTSTGDLVVGPRRSRTY